MLPLVLTIVLSAAAPRGLAAAGPVELVTQIDAQLAKWLPGGAAVKPLLASRKEVEAFVATFPGIEDSMRKSLLERALQEQTMKADRTSFTAIRALLAESDGDLRVDFFDAQGLRCGINFLRTDTGRFVLMAPPLTDARKFESAARPSPNETKTYLEKKDGVWAVLPLPKPPPPDCNALLKRAAQNIYVAEKSYFAELDAYSSLLEKIGYDEQVIGVSAKVTQADAKSFTAELSLNGGVVRVNEKNELTVVKPCAP